MKNRVEEVVSVETPFLDVSAAMSLIETTLERFVQNEDPAILYGGLLEGLVEITQSEFGFIGEIMKDEEGLPYLKTNAITDISWDAETRALYQANAANGFEFRNLDTLFGHTLQTGEMLISNSPETDPRRGGTPKGHPPLKSYVGIPINSHGSMVGMAGLANRPGGYSEAFVVELAPIISAYASLLKSKQYQAELIKSRHRSEAIADELDRLLRTAGAPILGITPDFKIEVWSRNLADLTGCPEEDALGKGFVEIFVPVRERRRVKGALQQALSGSSEASFELPLMTAADREVLLLVSGALHRNVEGEIIGLFLVGQDVTALKHTQGLLETQVRQRTEELTAALSNLEASSNRVHNFLDRLGDGLIVVDSIGRIQLFNPKAKALLGLEGNLEGLLFTAVLTQPDLVAQVKGLLTGKEQPSRMIEVSTHGGLEKRILTSQGSVVLTASGALDAASIVLHDVTAKERLNQMKSEFLATAAHELRTPLTSIQGFSEILRDRPDLPMEKRSQYCNFILDKAGRLSRIVDDLLNLSRLQGRQTLPIQRTTWTLQDMLRSCVADANERGTHECQLDPGEDVTVNADRAQLEQVMQNLLTNAMQYSKPGALIHVTAQSDHRSVTVSVQDHGIGIPAGHLENIFEVFYRVDASDTAQGGLGLGLGLCRGIIENHGGRIWVDSKLGHGTKVSWQVPLAEQ